MLKIVYNSLLLITILFFTIQRSDAQGQNIKRILAKIMVEDTTAPVPFAFVANSKTGIGKETNENGLFRMDVEPTDTLLFRCMGYDDNSWAIANCDLNSDTVFLSVTSKSYALQEIKVFWFRSYAAFRHKVANMPMMETNEYTLPLPLSVRRMQGWKKAESGTFGVNFSLGGKGQTRGEKNYKKLLAHEKLYERYNKLTSRENLQCFTKLEGTRLDSFIVFLRSKHNIDPHLSEYDMMAAISTVYEEFLAARAKGATF